MTNNNDEESAGDCDSRSMEEIMNQDEDITSLLDREREALVNEAVAIRNSGAWVLYDGERWYAMRIDGVVSDGAGATVEEALAGLEVRQ